MECKTCHGEGTPAKIELEKDAAHALCKDCHKTKGAGPTKCGDCHKK
jgi:predicted CXXCH cytochrome family protein